MQINIEKILKIQQGRSIKTNLHTLPLPSEYCSIIKNLKHSSEIMPICNEIRFFFIYIMKHNMRDSIYMLINNVDKIKILTE